MELNRSARVHWVCHPIIGDERIGVEYQVVQREGICDADNHTPVGCKRRNENPFAETNVFALSLQYKCMDWYNLNWICVIDMRRAVGYLPCHETRSSVSVHIK